MQGQPSPQEIEQMNMVMAKMAESKLEGEIFQQCVIVQKSSWRDFFRQVDGELFQEVCWEVPRRRVACGGDELH